MHNYEYSKININLNLKETYGIMMSIAVALESDVMMTAVQRERQSSRDSQCRLEPCKYTTHKYK